MHQPLVTVIVPTFNMAGTLERCLDSICVQSYDNLEIMIVDDGSTDGRMYHLLEINR
jgi:glycosyltransferase involved in cell wall biosynthesis